jgi:hypothetical protein
MLLSLLLAAAADGKVSATDDWNPATIVAVGSPSPASPETYVLVQAGDLDGDGLADDAYLKLHCDDGKLTQSWYQVKGPRDSATGMASGKRMHKPFTIVKEWGAATPELAAVKPTYDIKTLKGARMSAVDDWSPINLAHTDGLCPAASAAARAVVKSKSNITNN